MPKLYSYVGPTQIAARVRDHAPGTKVNTAADLLRWVRDATQQPDRTGVVTITFVIDSEGFLLIADRRSEHVACAGGGPVLSAGEMWFAMAGGHVEVVDVSNQSTGFCPEPESWLAVAAALERAGIKHPGRFTIEITFRSCPRCGERNVVKDGWFACGVCGSELPSEWNF